MPVIIAIDSIPLEDDIYNSLCEIEKEEKVRLNNKAFITDFLSKKLEKLGYKK